MSADTQQFFTTNPYFLVSDVFASAEHYRDVFGFTFDQFWGEPPQFVILMRGQVQLMLHQATGDAGVSPNGKHLHGAYDACFYVQDVDALHAEYSAKGADLLGSPKDEAHGCREFLARDPDGYALCFGQALM